MPKWILPTFLALAVLAGAGAAGWHFLGPVTVEAERPTRGPAVEGVYGSGTVEPGVMLPIAPKLAGRLQRLVVDEGAAVKQGDVLAELDKRELSASVAEWEARVRYSEAQYRRAMELFRNRIGTESALDQTRNEFETAKAALELVKRQLDEMTLIAPADGVVIRRDGEIGQLIQSGTAVFWMSCCEPLRVTAEIDEEDIRRVKAGQKVLIRSDAFPDQVFEGQVAEITPKGDPVTRSFRVRIRLGDGIPLMIGMTADCNIVLEERAGALLVPAAAVTDGKVWVLENGTVAPRAVTLGVVGERKAEIKAGLGEGDLVVLRSEGALRDGRRARRRE